MGDSFVEALQVPFQDSFFGLLEAAAAESTRLVNFAVSSYSPILYLLQWRTDVRAFHPTHVFLLLYGNDVRDDETYGRRARYTETGELVGVPGPQITWWRRLARHSYALLYLRRLQMRWQYRQGEGGTEVGGYVEENPDLTPETRSYLDSLREDIVSSGAMLVVMAVPSKFALRNGSLPEGDSEFAERVEAWARGSGVVYLDLVGPFRAARMRSNLPLFFEADIHFTEAGNKVVAETVARAFPDLFPSPP
jgi:hypothetical protein